MQELISDEDFQRLFTKVADLAGVKSFDEASVAKRKQAKPNSISDSVAYSQLQLISQHIFFYLYILSKFYKHYLPNVRLTLPYFRDDTPGSNVLVNPVAIT